MAVVTAAELVAAAHAALSVPILSHSIASKTYDLYEAYLFGVVVEAAESIGLAVRFESASGASVAGLVLRASPSTIWSGAQPFTHAVFIKNNAPVLEAHLGIYIFATSGLSHEADVVVLDAEEASRARALQQDPRASSAAVVVEAKFHASLALRTGREYLGLTTDLGKTSPILATSAPGPSVHRLVSYRGRAGHFELIPGSVKEGEFRSQVATRIRDHLARRGR